MENKTAANAPAKLGCDWPDCTVKSADESLEELMSTGWLHQTIGHNLSRDFCPNHAKEFKSCCWTQAMVDLWMNQRGETVALIADFDSSEVDLEFGCIEGVYWLAKFANRQEAMKTLGDDASLDALIACGHPRKLTEHEMVF